MIIDSGPPAGMRGVNTLRSFLFFFIKDFIKEEESLKKESRAMR
jgi:hypothetical protein